MLNRMMIECRHDRWRDFQIDFLNKRLEESVVLVVLYWLFEGAIHITTELVSSLLKYKSSVNLCDTDGSTPLHAACINDNIDIVNILLMCNSRVNLCDTDGSTPLHLACYKWQYRYS